MIFRDTLGNTEHCMLVGSSASSVLVSPVEGRDLEQVGEERPLEYMCHESRSGGWEGGGRPARGRPLERGE